MALIGTTPDHCGGHELIRDGRLRPPNVGWLSSGSYLPAALYRLLPHTGH